MAAEITLKPLDERGREMLDEFELQTEVLPFRTRGDGSRSYALSADGVDTAGFDPMLDRVAPTWRDHIACTG